MSGKFPLPVDFWHPPELNPQQIDYFVQLGKDMMVSITNNNQTPTTRPSLGGCSSGGARWSFSHDKRGSSLYRSSEAQEELMSEVRGVGKITATIDEVMDMMICDTTAEFRQASMKLNEDFIDGSVLYTILPRTEEHPNRYLGIKWVVFKSPIGFRNRDYCYLEYIDVCKNRVGNVSGFRVAQSLDIRHIVPSLEQTHNVVRGEIAAESHIFSLTPNPHILRVVHTLELYPCGKMPKRVAYHLMEKYASNFTRMEDYIEDERISQMQFVQNSKEHMNGSKECGICTRSLNILSLSCLLRRPYTCISCGEVICSSCSYYRRLPYPSSGEFKARICCVCILRSRKKSEVPQITTTAPTVRIQNNQPIERFSSVQLEALTSQLEVESTRMLSKGSNRVKIEYNGIFAAVCVKVVVTGSWCQWRTDVDFGAIPLHKDLGNCWSAVISLAPGKYQYKFFIDGHIWTHGDESSPENSSEIEEIGIQGFNRVLIID